MKLTWTNTEWDNFNGVASQDNLLMLNAGDDFLNAGGQSGSDNVDKYAYNGNESSVNEFLKREGLLPESKFKTDKDLAFINSKLEYYVSQQTNALDTRNAINVSNTEYVVGGKDKKAREKANRELWAWDTTVSKVKAIRDNLVSKLEKEANAREQAKADADAKAKAKADADAKAKADAEAKAKMKDLNNQLINAKTPEEKARIQAEIDALAGNVANATGSSKTIVYVVVGLAIIGGAYMLFKRKA